MLILVKHKITGEYFTIYRKDKNRFLSLEKFFNAKNEINKPISFNFELIENTEEIRHILEEEFTSKGRGEEYNPDLPSVTKIAYSLYPMDIDTEKFLIRYLNDKVKTPEEEQQSEDTLSKGTFIHKICELWVTDTEGRSKDKPLIEKINILQNSKKPSKKLEQQIKGKILEYINKYIEIALRDDEILRKIKNLDELKDLLIDLSQTVLPKFFYQELINTDLVYSEIFLSVPDSIQGSVDLVAYKDNKFSIIDFKTTSSVDKKSGKPKFKNKSQLEPYSRQLAIYNELLKQSNMTHCTSDELPDFYIYQIHLIGKDYRRFDIPKEMVERSTQKVQDVLNWYWNTRKGIPYELPIEEEEDYGILTL